jgi:hypothetical protein
MMETIRTAIMGASRLPDLEGTEMGFTADCLSEHTKKEGKENPSQTRGCSRFY